MSKVILILLGAIVVLIVMGLLVEIAQSLIGILFFVSIFIIVVGGAFLILRNIFRG